jgi:predicted nucleic-acid-binding Zn-ribbon protein
MNSEIQCIKCGELGVSERQAQKGNAKSAFALLRAWRIAAPIGALTILENLFAPKDWPRLPLLVGLAILVFAVFCLRDGNRATPRGPFRTAYTCDACGYMWFPAAAEPRRSKLRSGKRAPSRTRGVGPSAVARSQRRGK